MITARQSYVILAAIVALYLVIGVLYAVNTPDWQAPDEPAHYNYVRQVVEDGCCPVIEMGDWDQAYLQELTSSQFPEDADLSTVQYEDHQPPLFYLLAAPVYMLSGGSLLALRIFSVVWGACFVIAAYFVPGRLFPRHRVLALSAAAFVAFIPQYLAITASFNNDSVALLVLGMLCVVAITYAGNPTTTDHDGNIIARDESSRPHAAALGGLLGVAFLTKLTIYLPAALVVLAACIGRWRAERHPLRWLVWQFVWVGLLAAAFGAVWWLRDVRVYGWPDILGQARHNAVVVGQLRTADYLAQIGAGEYLRQYLATTYHSFWGQFGWMAVPLPARDYLLIGLFSLWALAGVALMIALFRKQLLFHPAQTAAVWALAALAAATLLNYIYYNLTFVQFQGRYLYTMLIPLAMAVALGGWGWGQLAGRWLKGDRWARALGWLALAVLVWMPIYAVWALFKYLVPNLG